MNKYIGESEKNLAQLLDHAAASDVVLLFDEADSLFGGRTEGRETGERYANMLTNFLLTRIENHPGIVILTTNSRERIDNAFTRRLDVIVEFPLPAYEERLHLWRSHLGDRGPGEAVYRMLAGYCDLAGGQLRNVVIAAAARCTGSRIHKLDLLAGLQSEYQKIGRELPAKVARLLAVKEGDHERVPTGTDLAGQASNAL
jgi:SpoVK/Ycf46/Vps4 family AAA+-type ATPase